MQTLVLWQLSRKQKRKKTKFFFFFFFKPLKIIGIQNFGLWAFTSNKQELMKTLKMQVIGFWPIL